MDYIDKKIAKLNKKKLKKIEKQKKLQADLDSLSDRDILYRKGLYAGAEMNFKTAGYIMQMAGIISLTIGVIVNSVLWAMLFCGCGIGTIVSAGGMMIASSQYSKKWQMYQNEATNRETKKRTAEYQKEKELERFAQTENVHSKTTAVIESRENELNM